LRGGTKATLPMMARYFASEMVNAK
jgi:hypothetical protein